jgi:phenylalanyl-tRNA synthetase alpha chain
MGTCFRRDTPDATHMPVFHQIEGLVVDHGITFPDLGRHHRGLHPRLLRPGLLVAAPAVVLPRSPSRRPSSTSSRPRRLVARARWLRDGAPQRATQLRARPRRSGAASPFGFGTDRMPMMRHGIDDLRELFTNDVRFLEQF